MGGQKHVSHKFSSRWLRRVKKNIIKRLDTEWQNSKTHILTAQNTENPHFEPPKCDNPGFWECAQHGPRCCAYSGATANEWNRKGIKPPVEGTTWGCKWIPGRNLTVEEMDAREAYWTSFGKVNNLKEE